MQQTSVPADSYMDILSRLPEGVDLDALAVSTKAIKRQRRVGDGTTLLRLALARGPGGMSLNQTAAWAAMSGLAQLSDPALKKRLDNAVPFLKALMEQQLAALSDSRAICWPGRTLRLVDGTNIKKPGSKGTDWRVHAGFDLGNGRFSHLELTDHHGAESLQRGAPEVGEIRIGDRNYARAKALSQLREDSAGQADFIVRVRWKAFRLSLPGGAAFDLISHLCALPDAAGPHEVAVCAQVDKQQTLPLRLIVLRKTPEQTEKTQQQLKRQAPRKQKKLDPRSLVAAGFIVLATSLPIGGYPAEQVLAAYRLRWQIELAFKRLKSLLHIDRLPTRTDAASRSWLYAHLILALLCDDLSQEFLESSPSGPH